jgi:hypothetical protein
MKKYTHIISQAISRLKKQTRRYIGLFLAALVLFGVLGIGAVYATGPDKWLIAARIPGPVRVIGRKAGRFIADMPYLHHRFVTHELPVYDVRIDLSDLVTLRTIDVPANVRTLPLEYREYVPAVFIADGKEYDVEIRIRGNGRNHWLWDKKSYRIKFDNDDRFHGYRRLNYIVPVDREYLAEELNMFRAKQLGLDVPDTQYVVLTINGEHPAVYWMTEQWGEDFLERHQLTADANFFAENNSFGDLYTDIGNWKKYTADPKTHEDDYGQIGKLHQLLAHPSDEIFWSTIFDLIDEENFYAWSTHNALSFGIHQDWSHNIRLYWDPTMGRFMFIPWDVVLTPAQQEQNFLETLTNPLVNRMLRNPDVMRKRNERLWNYVGNQELVEAQAAYYDDLYQSVRTAFYQDTIRRFPNTHFDSEVERFRSMTDSNIAYWQKMFREHRASANTLLFENGVDVMLSTRSASPHRIVSIQPNGQGGSRVNKVSIRTKDDVVPCVSGSNSDFDCTNHIIEPTIVFLHQPTPSELAKYLVDYYRAFELQETITQVRLSGDDSIDWSMIESIDITILNEYTQEKSQLTVTI